ncbi:sensor histidine kinase [Methylocella tundrae]|uniref:histidine kinase n=1 Tax=Methylocella tundrae TaxID=227605 RepID=A0A4U8Z0P0_METTU|nr:HAMP domain-containing sensor histidine kinase [Methylocella tundrae]WPP05997.1 HAMP domain-containing sensor histidine kinase [Methylocella tundrae]VFU08571.1 Histidine kinase [Methylocella tundrae]
MWTPIANLRRSATFRLAVFFAFAIVAATSLVLAFVYWQVDKSDTAHFHRLLVDEAAAVIDEPESQLRRQLELRLTRDLRRVDYAALFDVGGKHVFGNVAALPDDLPIDGGAHLVEVPARFVGPGGKNEPALFVARRRPDGGVLLFGRNLYEVYIFRQFVLEALALGIAPTIVLALIIGSIFSVRAARRLKSINGQIMRIMHGDLNERLPTHSSSDDLDHVARAVNIMLDEIVRLLEQIKSVGDNIAHDLRTPLAVMRARLERSLESDSVETLRAAGEKAIADLDHALTTVSALLRISEIEHGRKTSSFSEVDLKEVCVNTFDLFEPLAAEKSIAFTIDAPAPLLVAGDFDLLVEAVANLIDNAIKFTPTGGSVKIIAKMTPNGPLVRVSDTGPGVALSDRGSIFKRFYRSEKNRHIPGAGLGLSMAATIARLHGFDLRVADNHPGAAFEMAARGVDQSNASPSQDHSRLAQIPPTPSNAAAQSIK